MQKCVPAHLHDEAVKLYHSEGFFLNLPPMKGAIEAVKEMAAKGYRVFFCTSPVLTSHHCAGDKFEWVRKHFGQEWVQRIIITSDKTAVRGDVLIDDKPKITGTNLPTWRHLMFDAPYNMSETPPMRMNDWTQWEKAITALLSGAADKADEEEGADEKDKDKDKEVTPEVVAQLPDFSHLLPQDYRKDYLAWRSGQAKGAKGEIEDALTRMEAMQDSLANNTSEDFSEVTLYRKGYAQWRRGKSKGAKGDAVILGHLEGGAKSKKA
jgi:5'-nucleotidase